MVALIIVICLIIQGVQSKLIFSTTGKIKEINLENGEVSELFTNVESNVHSMDYDYTHGYIYFSRNDKNDISRFRYPSNQPYNYEIVTVADRPIGVAVDPVYNHVYWTERYTGKLYRCNVDGSNKAYILEDGQLYALAFDRFNRWLYYSTYDVINRSIKRVRLDGTEKQTMFNVHPEHVTGLSIDSNDREILYWMEHDKGNLKSRNADGTNDKVYSTNTASKNVGIHVYDSKIYCSNNRRILMVTLRPATTVNVLYADTGQVLSVIYHDEQLKECVDNLEGTDYTGTVNTTVYRLKCKDWSNTGFNMTLDTQRLLADQHNYCRNSERDPLGPWCYTTDDDTLWQTCTIPVCDMLYTNFCQENLNAYLAEIKTGGENNFLTNILPKPTIDDTDLEVWIGANALNVKRRFIWNTSNTYLGFTDCGPDEPNGRSYEHCLSKTCTMMVNFIGTIGHAQPHTSLSVKKVLDLQVAENILQCG